MTTCLNAKETAGRPPAHASDRGIAIGYYANLKRQALCSHFIGGTLGGADSLFPNLAASAAPTVAMECPRHCNRSESVWRLWI